MYFVLMAIVQLRCGKRCHKAIQTVLAKANAGFDPFSSHWSWACEEVCFFLLRAFLLLNANTDDIYSHIFYSMIT